MIELMSYNEFSLGLAKQIIYENKIEYKHTSRGYLISNRDYKNNIKKFRAIIGLYAKTG